MNWTTTGSLPDGLVIDAATGTINGTPTKAGSFLFTVNVKDDAGNVGSKDYTLTISATGTPLSISPVALPNGVLGQAYSAQLVASLPVSGGSSVFPPDHILNTPIDKAPLLANSAAIIAQMMIDDGGTNATVHPGFEIPVNEGVFPIKPITFTDGADESDPGPYAIPDNPQTEGGADNHLLVRQTNTNRLYEVFSYTPGIPVKGSSGATWDLSGYGLRPLWWTSTDAAGLPIYPLLIRYKEVAAGAINHAIRCTVKATRFGGNYGGVALGNDVDGNPLPPNPPATWPARHRASASTNVNQPSMGERFRLKASFDDSGFSAETRAITQCLKKYGCIVSDGGGNILFGLQGDTDPAWNGPTDGGFDSLTAKVVTELRNVHLSDFEVVDGVTSFIIEANSGKAKQL